MNPLDAERVLLIRLDNLGDVLLMTPAFRAVRSALPHAHLALLSGTAGCAVGELDPDIDETILYRAPWTDVYFTQAQDPGRELEVVQTLREKAFDLAIIFTSYKQSSLPAAYLCYLANIPMRAAGSFEGSGALLTHRHRYSETIPIQHETLRGLELVEAIGFPPVEPEMVLVPDEASRLRAAELLQEHDAGAFALVHPGASAASRAYPVQSYAEVVQGLAHTTGLKVLVTGGPEEKELTLEVAGDRGIALGGETTIGELAALVQRAEVVISNNTGTTHIASALKTPVVTIFAGTNVPEQWAPWRVPHRVLTHPVPCAPCYLRVCPLQHECMTGIAPGAVVEAATELLHETSLPEAVR